MDTVSQIAFGLLILWGIVVLVHGLYRSMRSGSPVEELRPPVSPAHD